MKKPGFSANKIFSISMPTATFFLVFSSLMLLFSCSSYRLEKTLDPEFREFLSQVRYLITRQERNIFLNLPPSERGGFMEEFWKKRDPDPYTVENEFKEQYIARIEDANNLFREGTTEGWLQDRGRIYILLGPPENREVYPSGYTFYGSPIEIWYYGFFPIVFIDSSRNGNYQLEPLSVSHISEINKAQMELKPKVPLENVVFDFTLRTNKTEEGRAVIQVDVPYKNIWFQVKKTTFYTTLALSLEVFDSSEKKVWETQKNFSISFEEKDLKEFLNKNYLMEIPVTQKPGNYTLTLELENKTDKSRVRKKIKFSI